MAAELESDDQSQAEAIVAEVFDAKPEDQAAKIRDLLLASKRSPAYFEALTALVAARIPKEDEGFNAAAVEAAPAVPVTPVAAFFHRIGIVEASDPGIQQLTSSLRDSVRTTVLEPAQPAWGQSIIASAETLWSLSQGVTRETDPAKIQSGIAEMAGLPEAEFVRRCEAARPPIRYDEANPTLGGYQLASVASTDVRQMSRLLMGLGLNIRGNDGQAVANLDKYPEALNAMMPPSSDRRPRTIPRDPRNIDHLYDATETYYERLGQPLLSVQGIYIGLDRIDKKDHKGNFATEYKANFYTTALGIKQSLAPGVIPSAPQRPSGLGNR